MKKAILIMAAASLCSIMFFGCSSSQGTEEAASSTATSSEATTSSDATSQESNSDASKLESESDKATEETSNNEATQGVNNKDAGEISSNETSGQEANGGTQSAEGDQVTNISTTAASQVQVEINGQIFPIELTDTMAAYAFADLLPLEVTMSELNGNEKYVFLDEPIMGDPEKLKKVEAGDVMLYGANCLVVFYKTHSTDYSYCRIGKIADTKALAKVVGSDSVEMKFSK